MILYGATDSGHSNKVKTFLELANIPHEYRCVDLDVPNSQRRADFVAHSKFVEVPVLVDGDKVLCQSNSILMYLAQKYQQFCGTADDWTQITEWLSWETNRIGFSLPNLRFAMRWSPQPADVMHYLRQRVLADLQTLNTHLATTEYLVTSGLSIADLSCSSYLFWLHQVEIAENDYPNVQRWLNRIRETNGWRHPDASLAA